MDGRGLPGMLRLISWVRKSKARLGIATQKRIIARISCSHVHHIHAC